MVKETGRIVAVGSDAVWVESIQRSTCGSCSARSGCGQALLSNMGGQVPPLRVLLDGRDASKYSINQAVTFGLPEGIVVKGSVLVYLLPLVFMLVFAGIAHTYLLQEYVTVFSAIVGFLSGGAMLRWHSAYYRDDCRHQPVIID